MVRGAIVFLVIAANVAALPTCAQKKPAPVSADSIRITFFDVDQGDAALIRAPNKRNILVDAGPSEALMPLFLQYAIDTLHLVVASHNHADHIGGMPAVFGSTVVQEYMENGVPALTQAYRRTVDAVTNEPNLVVREATPREFRSGKMVIRVLAPPHTDLTQNDNSVGLWVQFGKFTVVFTGDAETAEIEQWLDNYHVPRMSVVKAGHHGSRNGVNAAWMAVTRPRLVVVSVGAKNQYGHPDSLVVGEWTRRGARVFRTDELGSILVTAAEDGGFTVRTAKGGTTWVSPP